MGDLNGHRDGNGRFAIGNPGGPGRPRRAVEQDYLAALADAVPLRRWKEIVARAIQDAEEGDPKARRWLGEHLLGRQTDALMTLAVTEMAGTLDDEIQVRAAGLRKITERNKILNRVAGSTIPEALAPRTNHGPSNGDDPIPGRSPANGNRDLGRGLVDLHLDPEVSQTGRNGLHE